MHWHFKANLTFCHKSLFMMPVDGNSCCWVTLTSACFSCFMCKISCPIYFAYVIPKYLRTTLTNENCILEESKSGVGSGNACCHFVQNILSSIFLPKDIKIKVYRTLILHVVVKHGLSHWERNIGWGCLRIGCWGRYLYLTFKNRASYI
jgi:hypothetical protein